MMKVNDLVRIGFIGAGAICRDRHLPGLAAIDSVEVLAVANRSRESGQKVADQFNIADVEDDWQKLVERDDLDAVFIGTWPYMHKELSIAVLEAGKHCFCQARMCTDLASAKQMHAAAQARPQLVSMICPCPWNLEHYLRDMVAAGEAGQITSVELTSIGGGGLDRDAVTWRERRDLSGKQIMALGILAETLNALVGPYELLSAQLSIPIDTKKGGDGEQVKIEVPQVVTISGQLESGALIVEHHSSLAADQSSGGICLTMRGLKGTIRYDFADTIMFAGPGEVLKKVDVPENKRTTWTVEQDFVNAVRAARAGKPPQGRPVRPDFEEGLLYMRKVEAVHESAASGRAVKPDQL